jgi:hypothetical protein
MPRPVSAYRRWMKGDPWVAPTNRNPGGLAALHFPQRRGMLLQGCCMGNDDRRPSSPDDAAIAKLRDRSWMADEVAPVDFDAFGWHIGQIISQSLLRSRKDKGQT